MRGFDPYTNKWGLMGTIHEMKLTLWASRYVKVYCIVVHVDFNIIISNQQMTDAKIIKEYLVILNRTDKWNDFHKLISYSDYTIACSAPLY